MTRTVRHLSKKAAITTVWIIHFVRTIFFSFFTHATFTLPKNRLRRRLTATRMKFYRKHVAASAKGTGKPLIYVTQSCMHSINRSFPWVGDSTPTTNSRLFHNKFHPYWASRLVRSEPIEEVLSACPPLMAVLQGSSLSMD